MILNANALHIPLKDKTVQTCVTSPPYFGLRDYGVDGQIGLEETPEAYVEKLVSVFQEVKRVLKDDGTLWLVIGDSYAGSWGNYGGQNRGAGTQREIVSGSLESPGWDGRESERPAASQKMEGLKPKDLIGIPWMVAFALRADGWYLRSDIIWAKPNPMPESVTDRPTKAHEYLFLLSKKQRYYYDHEAIREPYQKSSIDRKKYTVIKIGSEANPLGKFGKGQKQGSEGVFVDSHPGGRNRRTVWTVATKPYKEAHFATFPPKLIEPCILAGSAEGDIVLDPFSGSGTTGQVAIQHRREYVGLDLNREYIELSKRRTTTDVMLPMMGV